MNRRACISLLTAAVCGLFVVSPSFSDADETKPVEFILLPDQQDVIKSKGGLTPVFDFRIGLGKITRPNSDTTYFVLDRQNAIKHRIADRLASLRRYDSDISIYFDFIKGDFTHIRLGDSDSPRITYVTGDPWLWMQLSEMLHQGKLPLNSPGQLRMLKYDFAANACEKLSDAISSMVTAIQDATQQIGWRSPPKNKIWVDGASYDLRVRLKGATARLWVGVNDDPIFSAVSDTVALVRKCVKSGHHRLNETLYDF